MDGLTQSCDQSAYLDVRIKSALLSSCSARYTSPSSLMFAVYFTDVRHVKHKPS
jgi:hypothetical protein